MTKLSKGCADEDLGQPVGDLLKICVGLSCVGVQVADKCTDLPPLVASCGVGFSCRDNATGYPEEESKECPCEPCGYSYEAEQAARLQVGALCRQAVSENSGQR